MVIPRRAHTATLLVDGRVLVAGGTTPTALVARAELYDPASRTWTATGAMGEARSGHTATLLPDGTVLVAGGIGPGSIDASERSAEVYDPTTGRWTSTGAMTVSRTLHTATQLPDGTVLVAGGSGRTTNGAELASTEMFEPRAGGWRATGALLEARYGHTATVLGDGSVLVAGGVPLGADHVAPVNQNLATAELYGPARRAWVAAGTMDGGRARHTATLLTDGSVLVGRYGPLVSPQLYDPVTRSWATTAESATVGFGSTATLLSDGWVLVVGGSDDAHGAAELYDPDTGAWSTTTSLATARDGHTSTLLADGTVLVAGGTTGSDGDSAELFDPGQGS